MNPKLRIVFFGTPHFAVPTLQLLHEQNWDIVTVITAPDKPFGRNKILTPSSVALLADQLHMPVLKPDTLKDDDFYAMFAALKPDVCIVVAYGKLIPERYLAVARLGFLNIHPSLLPHYRGPSPVASALLDGATQTGVSIMLLDNQMDHGPILASQSWSIPTGFTTAQCEAELSTLGAQLLIDTLPNYAQGTIQPHTQDDAQATHTKKFTRGDGKIDWSQSAQAIAYRIRALGANPGTWTTWNGKTLNIFQASPTPTVRASSKPGSVTNHEGSLLVATGDGALQVEQLQLEGSTKQSARDFLNGHPTIVDGILE